MAMFPVGSYYMLRADISDRGSAIAQSVMNDVVARGILDPKAWRSYIPAAPHPTFIVDNVNPPAGPDRTSYLRPLGSAMAEAIDSGSVPPNQLPAYLAQQFGSAFVIDPIGIAGAAAPITAGWNALVSPFPSAAYYYPTGGGGYASTAQWLSWVPTTGSDGQFWPIRRVTFAQPRPISPSIKIRMEMPLAASVFQGSDDLAYDLPNQTDRPAVQLWENASAGPLERQWVGEYSSIVTVVPTSSDAQMAMGRSPHNHAYDVSVVVFYKRETPSTSPQDPAEAFAPANALTDREPVVRALVMSTGPSGGEMLLESLNPAKAPFSELRAGQWLMVCGPHPVSSDASPRFVLNWYQVLSMEGRNERLNADGLTTPSPPSGDPERRLVTLRGPEWPWQPAASLNDNTHLSNDLCVGIFPSAVAVHTKTLRLPSN
jgi:hypothetical protein